MDQHSEYFQLFSTYYWMVFPLGAGLFAMLVIWLHHKRAQAALTIIQSYASLGKEAPPEVLALLRLTPPEEGPVRRAQKLTLVGFIVLAFAVSFGVWTFLMDGDVQQRSGLYFIVLLFAGVAAAFFAAAWMARRDLSRTEHH